VFVVNKVPDIKIHKTEFSRILPLQRACTHTTIVKTEEPYSVAHNILNYKNKTPAP
jgi:hypothetical protein